MWLVFALWSLAPSLAEDVVGPWIYCENNGGTWVEDPSNHARDYCMEAPVLTVPPLLALEPIPSPEPQCDIGTAGKWPDCHSDCSIESMVHNRPEVARRGLDGKWTCEPVPLPRLELK